MTLVAAAATLVAALVRLRTSTAPEGAPEGSAEETAGLLERSPVEAAAAWSLAIAGLLVLTHALLQLVVGLAELPGASGSLGSLAVVSAALLLGVLAWRSHSTLVGAAYALVGAFLVFLPVLAWRFAAQINDAPPVLPGPIADAVSQIYFRSAGPLNAIATIGGGMFVVGLLVVGRSLRARMVGRRVEPVTNIEEHRASGLFGSTR